MRAVIFFISSCALLFYVSIYKNGHISQGGEYHASHYVINDDIVNIRIVSHVRDNEFMTRTYLTSPGLSNTATFLSKGRFIDRQDDGTLEYSYSMSLIEPTDVVNAKEARVYMDLVARLGFPIEEHINILYHNNQITVFDMQRNSNVIMYEKE